MKIEFSASDAAFGFTNRALVNLVSRHYSVSSSEFCLHFQIKQYIVNLLPKLFYYLYSFICISNSNKYQKKH